MKLFKPRVKILPKCGMKYPRRFTIIILTCFTDNYVVLNLYDSFLQNRFFPVILLKYTLFTSFQQNDLVFREISQLPLPQRRLCGGTIRIYIKEKIKLFCVKTIFDSPDYTNQKTKSISKIKTIKKSEMGLLKIPDPGTNQ